MKAAITIRDVADDAGVSVATVSRALRNMAGVAESTRLAVLESAQRLGYTMSPMSIGRSAGQHRCIAILLPAIDTWFFGNALTALIRRVAKYGYRIEVTILANQSERNVFFASVPLRHRVSGVVVVGMALTTYENDSLRSLGVEVVGLHATLESFPNLAADDLGMARLATDHLIGLGHRRIAMISSSPGDPVPHAVPRLRTAGYRAALQDASIPPDPRLEVCGLDSVEGGAMVMTSLLARPDFPSAVFAHTDEMAFGALDALRRSGLEVPRDVSVVSIDDHTVSSSLNLTTVAQHIPAQAAIVADLLARRLANLPRGRQVVETMQPPPTPHLVMRSTTAPPRTANPAGTAHEHPNDSVSGRV